MPFIVTPWLLKQRSEFYRELAALTASGIPLVRALEEIQRRPPSHTYLEPIKQIIARILQGGTLAESLQSLGQWLPDFDLALIQAGEQSGRLVECYRALSDYYAERAKLMTTLIVQLAYPVFLAHFALLVFPVELLPKLVWEGQVMPYLQQKLTFLVPIYAVVFLLILAAQGRHGESWRSKIEQFTRWVPVLGKARREQALARLAASLEALISAGISIIEAWDLAAPASGSPAINRAVQKWKPLVLAGEFPSDQISRSREFPELFANLYHTGEISGQLDQELRHLHQYYQDSASRKMHAFIRAVVVVIFLAIMIVIAWQIISFYIGYFGRITDAIGQ